MDTQNVKTYKSNSKIASYARLGRIHTSLATSLIPLIAYVSVRPLDLTTGIYIFLITSFVHSGVCGMNDYFDYEEDKKDPEKEMRPIVSGELTKKEALIFSVVLLAIGAILSAYHSFILLFVTLVGIILANGYNWYSNSTPYADILYVMSILSLVLLGAVVSMGYTYSTIAIFMGLMIHALFQVQEGHMKDLKEDESNILQRVGVTISENNVVKYPSGFITAVYALKIVELGFILSLLYFKYEIATSYSNYTVGIMGIAVLVNIALYFKSLSMWLVEDYKRLKVVKNITMHELSAVMLILLCIMPHDVLSILGLMLITPLYLIGTNYLIHSNIVSPDI